MPSKSLLAVRQVIAWACEQGMSIRGMLSTEQLDELAHVFAGERAWSFDLYEPLRAFTHAIPRLELPDLPAQVRLGDALTALNEVLPSEVAAWAPNHVPSAAVLAELRYSSTSAGITRLREQHTAAWRHHAEQNKQLLRRAAERSTGANAAVVGAGKVYDIPLLKLAERFTKLTLLDVDGDSLAESVQQAGLAPPQRARLTLVTSDVTGVNNAFLARAHAAFAEPDEAATYDAVLALLHSYRLAAPPALHGSFDIVFSSMVLSQLATPLTEFVQQQFNQRFPQSTRLRAHEFQVALAQFTHRIQHDHVQALLAAAPLVAISSDISEQFVQLDRAGKPTPTSPELPLIGAPHLTDLFPAQRARILENAAWTWQRVPPTAAKPHGRNLKVIGTIATRV